MWHTPSAALLKASGPRRLVLGLGAATVGQFAEGLMHQCDQQEHGALPARREIMHEVNLRIFEIGAHLTGVDDWYTFFCECGGEGCDETIRLQLHRFDPSKPAGSLLAHVLDGEQEPLT